MSGNFDEFWKYYIRICKRLGVIYKLDKFKDKVKKFYDECVKRKINPFSFLEFVVCRYTEKVLPWCLMSVLNQRVLNEYKVLWRKTSLYEQAKKNTELFDTMYDFYLKQLKSMGLKNVIERYYLLVRGNISRKLKWI